MHVFCAWASVVVKCFTICMQESDSSMLKVRDSTKTLDIFSALRYVYLTFKPLTDCFLLQRMRRKKFIQRKVGYTWIFASLSSVIPPKGFVSCLISLSLFFLFTFFSYFLPLSRFPVLAVRKIVRTVNSLAVCKSMQPFTYVPNCTFEAYKNPGLNRLCLLYHCQCAYNNSRTPGGVFTKFDICKFYQKLSYCFNFLYAE